MSSQPFNPSSNPRKSWIKKLLLKREKKGPSKEVKPASVLSDTHHGQMIYVRICMANLQNLHPGQESTGHMYLIQGTFEDISRYAGTTVDWVIRVAHLVCNPLGVGQIFTHASGVPHDWYNIDWDSSWQEVICGNPLLPNIYEFVTTHPITLSKISARPSRSVTTSGPQSQANSSLFKRSLLDRDGPCVVTGSPPSIASHLIPRRVGLDGAMEIMEHFAGPTEVIRVHEYDPQIGVMLSISIDHWVDIYKVGFYHMANNTYTLHNFDHNYPNMLFFGAANASVFPSDMPQMHGYSVTLSIHAGNHPLPPPGVFNWHYLQCVILCFGTPQYRDFFNIYFFVHPFKTASDVEDDENDGNFDDMNPPYPSYHFDQFLQQQSKSFEHHEEVLQWASGIPPGSPDEGT